MKLNLRDRVDYFVRISKGKSDLFNTANPVSKMKLLALSLAKIPFSTYAPELKLSFGPLTFRCLGSYELYLYPEIFIDKAYSQLPGFDPVDFENGYTVVDVGANVGFYSIFVSSRNPHGKIYAFEPHPQAIKRLKENLQINNVKNVEIFEKAIWSKDGKINFEDNKYTVLARVNEEQRTDLTVLCLTLDRYIEQHKVSKIDILKIDAEFAEDEIIKGAESRALAITKRIVLEYHSEEKKNKVEKLLKAHRFEKLLDNEMILYFAKVS